MYLLFIALILILALIAIRLSDTLKVPQLLLFMLLGVAFNFFGVQFSDFGFSDSFASLALMFIIFYGGFGTKWEMTKPVAKEAITLSFLGTIATAVLTGLFIYWVFDFTLVEAMLFGSVVGSTDYASVSSVLQSRNLNLKYNTAPLLELESGSNDPTAFTMVTIFLLVLQGLDVNIPLLIVLQVGLGGIFGFSFGWLFIRSLDYLKFDEGLLTIYVAAAALLTYQLTNQFSGNGYLAVYIFGIYIGNKEFIGKREVVFFFDGLTNLAQIGLFFILGLLSNPTSIIQMMPISLAIMAFMTIIARPLTVYGLMIPFNLKNNQLTVISLAGLRGAAAIAFAIVAVNSGAPIVNDVFHIVFDICLLSALIQGSILPFAAHHFDMIDPDDNVLKTFNYYQDKSEIGFLETELVSGSSLIGKYIKDLKLEFDFILAKIVRNQETIVPRGNVQLAEGDKVVFAGKQYFDPSGTDLMEFKINGHHHWVDQDIMSLDLPADYLIILVLREDDNLVVPSGKTYIREGDTIIALDPNRK